MSTITTLNTTDNGPTSRTTINTNFANLNTDKQEKGTGVTGNIVAFGASNVLSDTAHVVPTGVIVGTTDAQTLTNKTLTSPTISSPAISTPTSSGAFTNNGSYAGTAVVGLANGGTGQTTQGPAADAVLPSQTSNSGKYLTTNGSASSWGAVSAVPAMSGPTSGQFLTNNGTTASWAATATFASGTTTYNLATASGVQNIAHGLGKVPKSFYVASAYSAASSQVNFAQCWNGNSISFNTHPTSSFGQSSTTFTAISDITSNSQTAVITADATNIILTWTKLNSPTGTASILWTAQA